MSASKSAFPTDFTKGKFSKQVEELKDSIENASPPRFLAQGDNQGAKFRDYLLPSMLAYYKDQANHYNNSAMNLNREQTDPREFNKSPAVTPPTKIASGTSYLQG